MTSPKNKDETHCLECHDAALYKHIADAPARFQFANVVVVNDEFIGVIVKAWHSGHFTRKPGIRSGYHYEVYVREWNTIKEYDEADIKHFVFSKSLSDEEREFH